MAGWTDGHAPGLEHPGDGGRTPVAPETVPATAGHGRDHPGGVHHPDAGVHAVGDEQVAPAIHRHATRVVELRRPGRAAVAGEVGGAGARQCGHHPGGVDPPDAVVVVVGHVEVARAVTGHAAGAVELG